MTERRRTSLARDSANLQIGPSALSWAGGALSIDIDEITAPLPTRLRGSIRITPEIETTRPFALDSAARHTWRPIAPRAHAEVDFSSPALRWSGDAYFDMNHGDEPLEDGFRRWDWARANTKDSSALFYDVERRDGSAESLSLHVKGDGEYEGADHLPRHKLARTGWALDRQVRADTADVSVRKTLEDTPFYARSALTAHLHGAPAAIMHESLSLDRFRAPIVRAMLPFRMPRVFW